MRYTRFFLLLLAIGLLLGAVESFLIVVGAPISFRDSRGIGQVLMIGLAFLAIIAFVELVAGTRSIDFFMHYVRHWRRALAGFLTMFTLAMTLAVIMFAIFVALGWANWSAENWQKLDLFTVAVVMKSLLVALVLATTEELIFRGVFLRYLRENLSVWHAVAAIVVSSAVFSVSHLIALRADHTQFIPLLTGLFLLGILLATTYVVTGSIACSIGLHLGLLGFKVILRKTGIGDFAGDVRTGADFFLMMALLTLIVVLARRKLWERFSIEPAALLDEDVKHKRTSFFEPGRAPAIWG